MSSRALGQGFKWEMEGLCVMTQSRSWFCLGFVKWGCLVSGTGTNTKLLQALTEEARSVMAAADSVFMSVTDDILKGRIRVKHLEEIFQHEKQFICIWEISKSHSEAALLVYGIIVVMGGLLC